MASGAARYRKGALLGKGTHGAVYEAVDVATGRRVAIKKVKRAG